MITLLERITQCRLKTLLDYDAENGTFVWKVSKGPAAKGSIAGTVGKNGYVKIFIDYRQYYAHRLVWLFVYGKFPENELDHIDCDPSNNRISNLREATHAENQRNISLQKNSKSGIKGVSLNGVKWSAHIWENGKKRHLGSYLTKREAEIVVKAQRRELHGIFTNHG